MKFQHFSKSKYGRLVNQLPRDVTFAYDLHFGFSRDHWKDLMDENNSEKVIHHYLG